MTRAELRVFLGDWYCGCGDPEEASEALYQLLRAVEAKSLWDSISDAIPKEEGLRFLLIYSLDSKGLLEHGCNIQYPWLSPLGARVLRALEAEAGDDFEALHGDYCLHGVDVADSCELCEAFL